MADQILTLKPFRTGYCQVGNHHLCHGNYAFARCCCDCHTYEPGPFGGGAVVA